MITYFADLELGSHNLSQLTNCDVVHRETLTQYTSSAKRVSLDGNLPHMPGLYVAPGHLKLSWPNLKGEPRTHVHMSGPSNVCEWTTFWGSEAAYHKGDFFKGDQKLHITKCWLELEEVITTVIYIVHDEGCRPESRRQKRMRSLSCSTADERAPKDFCIPTALEGRLSQLMNQRQRTTGAGAENSTRDGVNL